LLHYFLTFFNSANQNSYLFNYCVVDAYGNLIDDSEWRRDEAASDEETHMDDGGKIEKFRKLIRSLQDDKPGHHNDSEFEMEVTWEPGTDTLWFISCHHNLYYCHVKVIDVFAR